MDESRWTELRELFERALEVAPGARDAFLEAECDDAGVRAEVRSLLAAAEVDGPLDVIAPRMASLHDVLGERMPERVGPYTVSGVIGEGGMAVVYHAHDSRLRRDVALKFLPSFLHDHTPAADRLIAEARAASALDHPNICTIYDIGSAKDDRIFIAMAYYRGGTLQDRLREGPLPVPDIIEIAGQVADALDCAHDAGIVHRDVKPANIAFGERGEAKVLDFGVAVLGDDDAADAAATAGTPSYMAPEQVLGAAADRRSDVWALGVVTFEMLTGTRPFPGRTREDVHDRILNAAPAPVTTLRPGTPPALGAIVSKALARDPEDRFATAAEMAAALEAVHVPAAPSPQARSPRRLLYSAAAVIVVLASAAAVARLRPAIGDGAAPGAGVVEERLGRGIERYRGGTPEANEAAIAILRSIVERDSTHVLARAYLAGAYAVSTRPDFSRPGRTEWLDSAFAHANAAVAMAPQEPAAHASLGVVLRWAGRLDDAIDRHHRALALDPGFALSMLELGMISRVVGKPDEAALWLERGLAIEPDVPAARQYASALYRAFDMRDDAHRHLYAGRTIAPDDASLIWETVLLAFAAGDTAAARSEFDSYLQLLPPGERGRMRAWFAILAGDTDAALRHIDRLDLSAAPDYDLREFGVAYMQAGEHEHGRHLLERALRDLEVTSGVPEWSYGNPGFDAAYIHAALGNADEAIDALQAWFDQGGARSWRRLEQEHAWESLAGDPRFQQIVERSRARFLEKRARVAAELSRIRD